MPDTPLLPAVTALGAPAETVAALRAAGLAVTVVEAGDGATAEAARRVASPGRVVLVGGPASERAAAARATVDAGAHAFLAWPPGVSADEAAALGHRADEAGVEVGVARPLPVSGLLAARPVGTSRLVVLALEAAAGGPLAEVPPAHRLAGALDLAASLAGSHDAARLDAATDGTATVVALRLRTGTVAHLTLRTGAPADRVTVYASGPTGTVEARSLGGPWCVDGAAAPRASMPEPEAVAFVRAVAAGRRAPFSLDDARATMALVERVRTRMR